MATALSHKLRALKESGMSRTARRQGTKSRAAQQAARRDRKNK